MKDFHSPVGLRTIKTAVAVAAAILLVEHYGTSADELLFGVMGAFAAMDPTLKGSIRNSIAQITSVILGVILSLIMRALHIPGVVAASVGIILVMALYQMLHWRSSPVLPCLILVTICTKPELSAMTYGLTRIWNTALGLGVGLLINTLVFPYDNSKKVEQLMVSLDEDLILFLEDMFNDDEHLPGTEEMEGKIESVQRQLAMLAEQKVILRKRQKNRLEQLRTCEETARGLMVEVEVLRSMEYKGRLNHANREALRALGAKLREEDPIGPPNVPDVVVNYHVARVLELREQLKVELAENRKI